MFDSFATYFILLYPKRRKMKSIFLRPNNRVLFQINQSIGKGDKKILFKNQYLCELPKFNKTA